MREPIILNGKPLVPLLTPGLGDPFIKGADEQGPYLACRLGNRNPSALYGYYVFVSPEDEKLMEDHAWFGNICGGEGGKAISIRYREGSNKSREEDGSVKGQEELLLKHEVWKHMTGQNPSHIYSMGNPLDYRRINLSASPTRNGCRGIAKEKKASGWQVQIYVGGDTVYIASVASPDEGYRVYNNHLWKLKKEFPKDREIQAKPYNVVTPQF